jgi:hypothetical protein
MAGIFLGFDWVVLWFLVQKRNRTSPRLKIFGTKNVHIPTYLGSMGNPFFLEVYQCRDFPTGIQDPGVGIPILSQRPYP